MLTHAQDSADANARAGVSLRRVYERSFSFQMQHRNTERESDLPGHVVTSELFSEWRRCSGAGLH